MTNPWQEYKKKLGDTRPWDLFNSSVEKADDTLSTQRMDICQKCPEFIAMTSQCKQCGCFMKLKTKLLQAKCPIGHW